MTECLCQRDENGNIQTNPQCPAHGTGWTHIGASVYMAPKGTPLPETFHPTPLQAADPSDCGACDGTGQIPTPENTTRECPLCNGTGTQP